MVMARTGPGGQRIIKVQPKSYEGMVRAFVQVDERVEALRDSLLSMVEPELRAEAEKPEDAQQVFEKDDMRAVVRMLLQRKRAKQIGASHADPETDNDED
jgi:hypothetical protein